MPNVNRPSKGPPMIPNILMAALIKKKNSVKKKKAHKTHRHLLVHFTCKIPPRSEANPAITIHKTPNMSAANKSTASCFKLTS